MGLPPLSPISNEMMFTTLFFIAQEPALQQHKILLLEGSAKPEIDKLPDNYSNRVCALNQGSVDLLDSK